MKNDILDLAIFSNNPLFQEIRSTSNLIQPNPENFFLYMKESFSAKQLTNNGPIVKKLENRLAKIHQTKFCVAVCSGFWAIALCMKYLAIKDKKEVIMPSLTYRRMADIAAWVGLTPHFCEVDPITLGMRGDLVEKSINQNTALIMGVHPIVNLCDIDGLEKVAKANNIPLLFDSVEAAYASHNAKMLGSFGKAECFSFHASKFLNGFEGGYITTNDENLADAVGIMRGFGFSSKDNIKYFGINAKLNEMHAAMALACLDEIEEQISHNYKIYSTYKNGLEKIDGIDLVKYSESEKRTYKNILVHLNKNWKLSREDTIRIMHKENMLVRPYYFPPLHKKISTYPTICEDLKLTEQLSQQYLLLPCGSFTNSEDAVQMLDFISFLQEKGDEISKTLKNKIR